MRRGLVAHHHHPPKPHMHLPLTSSQLELRSAQGRLLPVVAEIRSVAREAASARALLLVQAEGSTVPQIRSQKVK